MAGGIERTGIVHKRSQIDLHDNQPPAKLQRAESRATKAGLAGEIECDIDRRKVARNCDRAEFFRDLTLLRNAVDGEDVAGAEEPCELDRGGAEAAEAEDGEGFAGAE